MTQAPTRRRRLAPAAALLIASLSMATAATASEIIVYNDSHAPIDKVYARPVDPSVQDEMYANFRIDAGPIAPGGSMQLQVTAEFCQFDLLVTFQGTSALAERTGADLCWHPIVIVLNDGISLQ